MSIVIMVDGGVNLSKEILKKYGIQCLPYNVIFNNGDVYKGVKASKELTSLISIYNEVPKVDQLSKREIEKCFRKNIDNGDDIIYIGASSLLTSSHQDIVETSEKFNSNNIAVIDSMNIGNGEAILALYAYEYIQKGYGFKKTVRCLNSIKERIKSCYLVGNPTYLYRDKRCRPFYNNLSAYEYSVPILEIDKGKLVLTLEAKEGDLAFQILKNTLIDNRNFIDPNYMIISYSGDKTNAQKLKRYVKKILNIDSLCLVEDNPTIYTNIGSNSLSIAFLIKEN